MKKMMAKSCGALVMGALMVLGLGLISSGANAASFVVTKTADSDDGACNSDCSLREAVYAANGALGADTITFNATAFAAPRKTIAPTWSINITENVTITGPTAGVIVNSDGNHNIFTVMSSEASATFNGLTLSNGHTGVENNGAVTLTNCTLSGNTSGIINYGTTATLTNCTVSGSGNEGILNGGSGGSGILNGAGFTTSVAATTVTLTNCTVSGNSTGIRNNSGSVAVVENSIVAGNTTSTAGDPVTDSGNNIIGGTAAAAGLDPAGLLDNGGPTPTIALVSGSPAIDGANDAKAPATDQRGIARPYGAHSDIGAYEAKPLLAIRDAIANEGNSGTTDFVFTVKLLLPSASNITVNYATANGTANSTTDYTAKSGTLTIPAGATSGAITVLGNGDTTIEPDETFYVNLSNPVNASIIDGQGAGTIIGDDYEAPSLIVNTTSDVESRTDGVISLRDAISYINNNQPAQSTITFHPTVFAAPRKTITVGSPLDIFENATITGPVAGVTVAAAASVAGESPPNSVFWIRNVNVTIDGLTISNAVNGVLNSGGQVTITNCTLSNNSDTGFYNYYGIATVTNCTLSGNSYGLVAFGAAADLINCTLSGNSNFGLYNSSGTTTLANCTVSGNAGGLKNDITANTIKVKNSIVVGNTTNTSGAITYGVNNITTGTAAAAGLETDGTGQPVLKDNDGPTKTIALIPGGGTAIDAASDADAPATDQRSYPRPQGAHSDIGAFELAPMVLTIGDVTANEGNSGITNFVFTVRLMRASANNVTVDYATANGTAIAGSDYTAKSGTVTIPAGTFTATITVPVFGNSTIEPDETFYVNLTNPVNAPIADNQAVGTIRTEDFEVPSLVVNSTSDALDNTDARNTLREAIAYANSDPNQSTITFAIPTAQQTGGVWIIGTSSPLLVNENTVITGPGANLLTVRESGSSKALGIFEMNNTCFVSGLTISNGGTGIANLGTSQLTLSNCALGSNNTALVNRGTATLTNCTASNNGYGIYNEGTINLSNCTLSGNTSPGIVNNSGATATATNCTFATSAYGIVNFGTATATDCTFSGNTSDGFQSSGAATLSNCTLNGNANYGFLNVGGNTATLTNCTITGNNSGMLCSSGSTTATNCTISGNTNTGIINVATLTLNNTLVVGNGTNLGGGTAPVSNNSITTGTAAAAGLDPSGLQNNGGPTRTIALLAGSAAINAGNNATAPPADQRGCTRAGVADIGAFEYGGVAGTVQFSAATYSVNEGAGTATITVTRTGGTNAASVNYAAAAGTAANPADFTATSGTLQFSVGQASRTFTVSIVNDTGIENNETINLTLSAPGGAALGSPATATLTIVDNDTPTYSISGRIATSSGAAISGVSVSRGAGSPVLTDSNGNYNFTGVPAGTYTLTPTKSGYAFNPATRNVTITSSNVTSQNFTGYNTTLSGRVAFSNGTGIGTVQLRVGTGRTVLTNGAGYYTFAGILNGAYTVTPMLSGYSFDPAYRSVTINNANVANVNFTGGYAINGRIANSQGTGLAGLRVYRTGSPVAAVTNSAGYFAFYGVVNGTYTLTPDTTQGYGYTPSTRSVTINGATVNNQNFTGTSGFTISGRIATSNGTGISAVTVTRTGGATAITNGAGYYTFYGVTNGSYTLTPSKSGMTFTPPNKAVNVNGANVSGQNFIGN